MEYVDLIAEIGEINRCPGGKRTISKIVTETHLKEDSIVLEVGCNTGFTSLEMAKISNAEFIGIDINEKAVEKANNNLSKEPLFIRDRVTFKTGDAKKLEFEDEKFDLIVTGGANSFIDQKSKALSEYKRVLKPYGMLSITNLFYSSAPPTELLSDLNSILGVEILPWKNNYWIKLFQESGFELYKYEEVKLNHRNEQVIDGYIDNIIDPLDLDSAKKSKYKEQWKYYIDTFNENHKYLSFMFVILRKSIVKEQQELFFEESAIDFWNIDDDIMW